MRRVAAVGSRHHVAAQPAEPRGRPWHAAQLSARPAPIARVTLRSPRPSPVNGPAPSSNVNLRWNSCRPLRIARNGSRAMTYDDEYGVDQSPRPGPICSPVAWPCLRSRRWVLARGRPFARTPARWCNDGRQTDGRQDQQSSFHRTSRSFQVTGLAVRSQASGSCMDRRISEVPVPHASYRRLATRIIPPLLRGGRIVDKSTSGGGPSAR